MRTFVDGLFIGGLTGLGLGVVFMAVIMMIYLTKSKHL
ncbi:hypothetical protein PQE70_gp039 [Bacillus phage vB_BanS_Nate]|uniref:Uncharacterized protein n=1 Tax=Bacillus phage vB_BanS_Nate TaxID=2894788 RepID=A0AAE8YXZ0_9CAUD|nr:hypothetical protein PQE70_gp039 [Bacillus phage vB_BanS_Nate]UGO50892.1 hypothetical protein NATE_39 [Bacillus phage vB_BanS_Nate]